MPLDILLLEDDPSKKSRLLALLGSDKDLFGSIDTALCTSDALRLMTVKRYDLFLADVVVPAVFGGEKSENNCIALFEQLDEGVGGVQIPHYCLPMSACKEITQEAHEFFRGRPWGILAYTDASEECLESVRKTAEFVLNEKLRDGGGPSVDVFVITALMEPEFSAVEALGLRWDPFEPLDSSQLVRFGTFQSGGRDYRIGAAFCPRMGPVAAAVLTTKIMRKLNPRLVLMAGICAGIPGKAQIGDVIAADISWDWQSGKYVSKNNEECFEIAPHQIDLDALSRNQLIYLKRDKQFWDSLAKTALEAKAELPKLVIGPMATGASVLADERVAERIKSNQHKNVAGLDMETYGVYAAVQSCNERARVISMKAVCDLGNKKKNDEFQEYASKVSAAAVFHFLTTYAAPLLQ